MTRGGFLVITVLQRIEGKDGRCRLEGVERRTSGAKALPRCGTYGTAKPVPFVERVFPV
jgi:hypothetical protein